GSEQEVVNGSTTHARSGRVGVVLLTPGCVGPLLPPVGLLGFGSSGLLVGSGLFGLFERSDSSRQTPCAHTSPLKQSDAREHSLESPPQLRRPIAKKGNNRGKIFISAPPPLGGHTRIVHPQDSLRLRKRAAIEDSEWEA